MNRAPPRVWPRTSARSRTHKHTQKPKKHKPSLFPFFLPPFCWNLHTPPPPLRGWVISRRILEMPPMDDLIRLSGNCWFQVSGLKWLPLPFYLHCLSPPSLYYHKHPVFISSYFTQGKDPCCELHKGLLPAWTLKITHFACCHPGCVYCKLYNTWEICSDHGNMQTMLCFFVPKNDQL